MISLGYLSMHANDERHSATELAKHSAAYNIEVFHFTPLSIDPHTEKVKGKKFDPESETWVSCTFDIPTFIYDRCYFRRDSDSIRSKPIVEWLKKRPDIFFLEKDIPSKSELHIKLRTHPLLSSYTLETRRVATIENFLEALRIQDYSVLLPDNSNEEQNTYIIMKEKNSVRILHHTAQEKREILTITNKAALIKWAETLLRSQPYVCQPLLFEESEDREPVILQVLLQKNDAGKWIEKEKVIQIEENEIQLTHWLRKVGAMQRFLIQDGVNTILSVLPEYLDKEFGPLFHLHLRLGIMKNGAVWILDVSSKPDHYVAFDDAPQEKNTFYQSLLQYCLLLSKEVDIYYS